MKYIVFSDLHLGVHNNTSIWLKSSIDLAKELADACEKYKADGIIFCGDFFHDRRSINVKTLIYAKQFIEIISTFPCYIIIGNHDTYYRNTIYPSSLEIFEHYPNIEIIKTPTVLGKIGLVPWDTEVKEYPVCDILAGHFEVLGCPMNDNMLHVGEGQKIEDFKKYKLVLSGHFHTPSCKNNLQYLGSVMPFTFADVDSKRGYYILNTDNYTLQFTEFHSCPKYIKIESNQKVKKEVIEGNCIKIIYKENISTEENEKFIESIQLFNPIFIEADFEYISEEQEENKELTRDITTKSNRALLFEYLDKVKIPDYINEETLKVFIRSLGE